MAESTLSLGYTDFMNAVCYYIGQGRDYTVASATYQTIISDLVERGLRQFYYPVVQEGEGVKTHQWSFLRAISGAITTVENDYTIEFNAEIDLFGPGEVEVAYSSATGYRNMKLVSLETFNQLRSMDDVDSQGPEYFCVSGDHQGGSQTGQRWRIQVWPDFAASPATIQVIYYRQPDMIATTDEYPYGGSIHSETILASCMACAELWMEEKQSIHSANFQARLLASIKLDEIAKADMDIESPVWPTDALRTDLSLTYNELVREVGNKMGFGLNHDTWSTVQKSQVDHIIDEGLRRFYYPLPVAGAEGAATPHEWSFLRTNSTLATVDGTGDYDLPADFDGTPSQFIVEPS